jgi:hypothetical protein
MMRNQLRGRWVGSWLFTALCLGASAAIAGGRTQALLVGVSQYPNLDQSMWLEGPRNDVSLFRDFLLERQVKRADITVLADGVEGAGEPNKRAIMTALASIAARAQHGDFVYLMFAGHGSQEPTHDSPRDEPDGLDEIFMPRDIAHWDGEVAAIPNAITDNEFGAAIANIRARGAFVWAVFDNCHSGTMTRGNAGKMPGERSREVKPAALGIPAAAMRAAAARAAAPQTFDAVHPEMVLSHAGPADSGIGGFVAFYAAQSQETTPEASLPMYSPDAVPRGLFSYTLYQVLSTHPEASYRQVIESVLQVYQGMGKQSPTPTYEGNGLDDVVFGSTPGQRVTQWRIDKDGSTLRLRAGLIQQVTNDSILAVVLAPTSKDSETLGYVKITNATTTVSLAVPVAYNGKPALDPATLSTASFARPVDLKVDFTLRVSPPLAAGECLSADRYSAAAVTALQAARGIAQRVRWVAANDAADVRMCQTRTGILFLDGSGTLAADPKLRGPALELPSARAAAGADPQKDARALGEALEKIGRVTNLARLAASISSGSRLKIELLWKPHCGATQRGCEARPQLITPTSRPTIRDGDEINVRVSNPSTQPVDVTILYVDAYYGITAMYPDADQGDLPRIEPRSQSTPGGGRIEFPLTANAQPSGFERMIVIGVPVQPQSPSTSFVGLAQQGIAVTAKRGGGGGLVDLFEEAAFGVGGQGTTRGAPGRAGGIAGSAELATFGWTVVAR